MKISCVCVCVRGGGGGGGGGEGEENTMSLLCNSPNCRMWYTGVILPMEVFANFVVSLWCLTHPLSATEAFLGEIR